MPDQTRSVAEGGLQQAELALDRIGRWRALGRALIVDRGVEPTHFRIKLL